MSKKKVLVIDDNPVVVRMNESLLTSSGYDVISAGDGFQGIQKAESEKPDVILLDLILPQMHGFEVCAKLKANPATAQIPIVIVTASGLESVAENEPSVQAEAYIAKPYGLKELEAAIQKVTS